MQRLITIGALASLLPAAALAGDCTGGAGTALLGTALNDQVVCGSSATNSDTWQEHHPAGGGSVTEFALGPGHPVDPSQVVGTWAPSGTSVTYTYNGGSSFTFDLFQQGATVFFCQTGTGTATVATATLVASATPAACP